jgi:hypothetical protein
VDARVEASQPSQPGQFSRAGSTPRRAILLGALGGVGAAVLGAVKGVSRASAADGDAMVVGGEYGAVSVTKITNSTNGDTAFYGENTVTGVGLWGVSSSSSGVVGQSNTGSGVQGNSPNGLGIYGTSDTGEGARGLSGSSNSPGVRGINYGGAAGVVGYSGSLPAPLGQAWTGVHGIANLNSDSNGVLGESPAGRGVSGSTVSGVAVYGSADTGYAIRSSGRIRFDGVSGLANIAAGSTSVTIIPGVNVTSSSFVLLTPKTNIGDYSLWFTTSPSTNKITIHISHSRSSKTAVAWLLMG